MSYLTGVLKSMQATEHLPSFSNDDVNMHYILQHCSSSRDSDSDVDIQRRVSNIVIFLTLATQPNAEVRRIGPQQLY